MEWVNNLNQVARSVTFPGGTIDRLYWNYESRLRDNKPHLHSFHEICQVGRYGRGTFRVGDLSFELNPGTVFYAGPSVVHQIINADTDLMELRWVSFIISGPSPSASECNPFDPLAVLSGAHYLVSGDPEKRTSTLWDTLIWASASTDYEIQKRLIECLIYAFAGCVSERPVTNTSHVAFEHDLSIRMALQYIADNVPHCIDVSDLAAQVHLSERHFARRFTQSVGLSPARYIQQLRMEKASHLLTQTDLPIKSIAAAVGYDLHLFTRRFSLYFGKPPNRYRNAHYGTHVRNVQKFIPHI